MPEAGFIRLAISMGLMPGELQTALDNESEYWRNRFLIYVGGAGSQ